MLGKQGSKSNQWIFWIMINLTSLMEFRNFMVALPQSNKLIEEKAIERNSKLTKPNGSLGHLEEIAIWYASWSGTTKPKLDAPQVAIFAGNHGIAAHPGVSAFPAEVTQQMVLNFKAGGAAINQLSKTFGAKMDVYPLDLDKPTSDFTKSFAMTESELLKSLQAGWDAVDPSADLFVAGEMGIGNTTSASAIVAALYGGGAKAWVGRGTGIDDRGLQLKRQVVDAGLLFHKDILMDPLVVLQALGGREIAAMVGAIASARARSIPVLLDGFICSAAAAVLHKINPKALDHVQAGHVSAERAHAQILKRLEKNPLLALDLRLGEGSGATLAIGVLKGSLACLSGMATFSEAQVSQS